MMAKVSFAANLKASTTMKNMAKHAGDVSEGSERRLIAERTVIGRKARFYNNGEHEVDGQLTPEEQYDSELLRFAHASLIVGAFVGDKNILGVDASVDPCDVWIYGLTAEQFVRNAKQAIGSQALSSEIIVDSNPIQELRRLNHVKHE